MNGHLLSRERKIEENAMARYNKNQYYILVERAQKNSREGEQNSGALKRVTRGKEIIIHTKKGTTKTLGK